MRGCQRTGKGLMRKCARSPVLVAPRYCRERPRAQRTPGSTTSCDRLNGPYLLSSAELSRAVRKPACRSRLQPRHRRETPFRFSPQFSQLSKVPPGRVAAVSTSRHSVSISTATLFTCTPRFTPPRVSQTIRRRGDGGDRRARPEHVQRHQLLAPQPSATSAGRPRSIRIVDHPIRYGVIQGVTPCTA